VYEDAVEWFSVPAVAFNEVDVVDLAQSEFPEDGPYAAFLDVGENARDAQGGFVRGKRRCDRAASEGNSIGIECCFVGGGSLGGGSLGRVCRGHGIEFLEQQWRLFAGFNFLNKLKKMIVQQQYHVLIGEISLNRKKGVNFPAQGFCR